jgi:hypothetical protein
VVIGLESKCADGTVDAEACDGTKKVKATKKIIGMTGHFFTISLS